jgi:hypothetical protein
MAKEIERSIEYIGYKKIYSIIRRIYLLVFRFSRKLKKLTDNIYFEQYKMKFGQLDDDIYIVAFPRSGTTLMQMILYHLTTGGEMKFKHIDDVSPWIRNAAYRRQEPLELPSPRIIKSHDHYRQFDRMTRGSFIFIYRNGMDTAVSLYHQEKNYNNENLDFEKFVKRFLKPRKYSWFNYTTKWFENRNEFPVLYVKYEDLISNKREQIQRVLDFLKLDVGEEAIQRAIKFSSFEYMKAHQDKFGVQLEEKKVFDQFIRKGQPGEGKKLFSDQQSEEFTRLYEMKVRSKELQIFETSGID